MLSSSSSIDECINRAVDFLTECDNESCRKGCVNMLLEVLSNPLIVSRVAPRTLESHYYPSPFKPAAESPRSQPVSGDSISSRFSTGYTKAG
ncbi:hypothetical protein FOZ63_015608 [Perkinsus olseni]|uniref:Uncharacterized protein n=1 Tax=Perkinsus olseni TaxID=32597 RepID=A0A7J6U744_PEROL|nr:hypothetical protein FOZ63_015608 [Perkinsus olseni]